MFKSQRIVAALLASVLCLWLTGCTTVPSPPVEKLVIKQVAVPVHTPCPAPGQKPVRPRRVADEHPVMPADGGLRERILGAKVLEWTTYGERADGIMTACSK